MITFGQYKDFVDIRLTSAVALSFVMIVGSSEMIVQLHTNEYIESIIKSARSRKTLPKILRRKSLQGISSVLFGN